MIKILDKDTINKIAAGEVIIRPANVVKELLENSMDAKADEIIIKIKEGGLRKIEVQDNGIGMNEIDARMCIKSHATSKISSANDLYNINSFGFRGEALSSIAEVSNLRIITKTLDENVGVEIEVEGGILKSEKKVGCNPGTRVIVSDLFFNVPVRKNYLKSNESESNEIIKIVLNYALIRNDLSIKLWIDENLKIDCPKTESLINNLSLIYGQETAKNLMEVDFENEEIKIKGVLSKSNLTRADKSDQYLFLNRRAVKFAKANEVIFDAMKTLIFTNRFPLFVLNILINPEELDVNIHPQKEIIRIKNEEKVLKLLTEAVLKTIKENNLIPNEEIRDYFDFKSKKSNYEFLKDRQSFLGVAKNSINSNLENFSRKEIKEGVLGEYRILGQIDKSFIILESEKGLVILDQHACEERVNYERFMKELKCGAIKMQKFLLPVILELDPLLYQIAITRNDFFKKMGFDFEDFGDKTIKLVAIPEIFGRLKENLFLDLLKEMENYEGRILSQEIEQRIIRFSCRASVKAGEELNKFEISEILEKLLACENPYTCPHGRPTMINVTISELEKKFKRTGW